VNAFHRWYCGTSRWRRRLEDAVLPWVLGGTQLAGRVLEIGPGPGLTTRALLARGASLTALEIDPALAASLQARLEGRALVLRGSAEAMPFAEASFDVVASFTMLHHLPSPAGQDRALAECRRVLKPGGVLIGCDSRQSLSFRLAHLGDTMVLVDPATFAGRLERLGFAAARVDAAPRAFRFRAAAPA
jgi:SAM-dependent methyltransferase